MLERISAREFVEWEILEAIDPWGERRTDFLFASLGYVIALTATDPKNHRKLDPDSFRLQFIKEEAPRMTPEQSGKFLSSLNSVFGGADLRVRRDDDV